MNSTSLKPLKNDRCKSIINKLPIPACDPAHPPKLDEAVSTLIPKSAKSHDKFLSKLQRYTLDAMGPLVWMLDQFQQGNEIDPKLVKGLSTLVSTYWAMHQLTSMWSGGKLS